MPSRSRIKLSSDVPAQPGSLTPYSPDVVLACKIEPSVVMGPRLRGDDALGHVVRVMDHSRTILPPHARGMRIGLFGGTFDPPHQAHRAACLIALQRLGLDRIWWLVTPGNPLKDTRDLSPLDERITAARALARHPRIDVSGFEAAIGARYTYDTIRYILAHCPGVHFVWIMGADNLRSFHRWEKWRRIAKLVPIAVVDRVGPSLYATAGPAGQALARWRIPEQAAKALAGRKPPALVYLHGLKSPLSSTALRAARRRSQRRHQGMRKIGRRTGFEG